MNEQDAAALERTYDAGAIEPRWQAKWRADDTYSTACNEGGPKCYVLDMFPYPSGTSMHVGHPRGYVATDAYSRFKRMQGFQVLHPMGWDSFGLPAEETAIARKEYPAVTVDRNIEQFKGQLQRLGLSYDWSREIKTTDPEFYRHTQRLFLEFFRRGLAYNSVTKVNWCAALGTVLANEDIVDGVSERGGHPVELLPMRQWMLRITAYADRLLQDLETLPLWPDSVKNAQREWIGRSEGHEFAFAVLESASRVMVYTTRLETIGGVTFVAIAPESDLARSLAGGAGNCELALAFIQDVRARTERDRRTSTNKTGIVLKDVSALNPVNGEAVPVVLADYVIEGYGTGAVMGVPAHDERDAQFAALLGLPTRIVIDEHDRLINSGDLDGMSVAEARDEIACRLGLDAAVQFKMRDWVFSRQRFWGEPIPIVWVAGEDAYEAFRNGPVAGWLPETPVSYEDGGTWYFALPIIPDRLAAARLPIVDKYQPTGRIEAPLAGLPSWVNVWIDPGTGEVSEQERGEPWIRGSRETNTMPQWAGSSWYWLRFMDPKNDNEPFAMEAARKWGPVDVYAGADHAVAHLLYARFWQKVLFDAGLVDHAEPFKRLEFLGYVLASDGTKISKRSGNSRNPDEVIADVGADAFRLYEMAIGPFEKAVPWNDDGLTGQHRFLKRVYAACQRVTAEDVARSDPGVAFLLHTAIGRVGEDLEAFKFNTAVSALMIFLKESEGMRISVADFRAFVQLLAPFAPHIAEELWERLGGTGSVHRSDWPEVDAAATVLAELRVPVQINGKRRAEVTIRTGAVEAEARDVVFGHPDVRRWIEGRQVTKFVFVANRIVNLVVT